MKVALFLRGHHACLSSLLLSSILSHTDVQYNRALLDLPVGSSLHRCAISCCLHAYGAGTEVWFGLPGSSNILFSFNGLALPLFTFISSSSPVVVVATLPTLLHGSFIWRPSLCLLSSCWWTDWIYPRSLYHGGWASSSKTRLVLLLVNTSRACFLSQC